MSSCQDKCVNQSFQDSAELTKGESVCIDRCVAKFLEVSPALLPPAVCVCVCVVCVARLTLCHTLTITHHMQVHTLVGGHMSKMQEQAMGGAAA